MTTKKQHKMRDYVSSNRDNQNSVIIADTSNKFPPPKLKVSQWADRLR